MRKHKLAHSIVNKKARHDYEVIDTYEAGIVLTGPEVKSLRLGRGQLKDSYVVISQDGNAELLNMHIGAYPFSRNEDYIADRRRRLLLKRSQIEKLMGVLQQKGISLVPLRVYVKNKKFKVEVGVVRGKKEYQKREKMRRRDIDRQVERDYKLKLR